MANLFVLYVKQNLMQENLKLTPTAFISLRKLNPALNRNATKETKTMLSTHRSWSFLRNNRIEISLNRQLRSTNQRFLSFQLEFFRNIIICLNIESITNF